MSELNDDLLIGDIDDQDLTNEDDLLLSDEETSPTKLSQQEEALLLGDEEFSAATAAAAEVTAAPSTNHQYGEINANDGGVVDDKKNVSQNITNSFVTSDTEIVNSVKNNDETILVADSCSLVVTPLTTTVTPGNIDAPINTEEMVNSVVSAIEIVNDPEKSTKLVTTTVTTEIENKIIIEKPPNKINRNNLKRPIIKTPVSNVADCDENISTKQNQVCVSSSDSLTVAPVTTSVAITETAPIASSNNIDLVTTTLNTNKMEDTTITDGNDLDDNKAVTIDEPTTEVVCDISTNELSTIVDERTSPKPSQPMQTQMPIESASSHQQPNGANNKINQASRKNLTTNKFSQEISQSINDINEHENNKKKPLIVEFETEDSDEGNERLNPKTCVERESSENAASGGGGGGGGSNNAYSSQLNYKNQHHQQQQQQQQQQQRGGIQNAGGVGGMYMAGPRQRFPIHHHPQMHPFPHNSGNENFNPQFQQHYRPPLVPHPPQMHGGGGGGGHHPMPYRDHLLPQPLNFRPNSYENLMSGGGHGPGPGGPLHHYQPRPNQGPLQSRPLLPGGPPMPQHLLRPGGRPMIGGSGAGGGAGMPPFRPFNGNPGGIRPPHPQQQPMPPQLLRPRMQQQFMPQRLPPQHLQQQPISQPPQQPQIPQQQPPLGYGGGGGGNSAGILPQSTSGTHPGLIQSSSTTTIPRKVLINPNFKGGVQAATNQLMLEQLKNPQFRSTSSSSTSTNTNSSLDAELLRQQEAFINQNRIHIEKRRHERTPERERDRSYSPPPLRRERRAYNSREREIRGHHQSQQSSPYRSARGGASGGGGGVGVSAPGAINRNRRAGSRDNSFNYGKRRRSNSLERRGGGGIIEKQDTREPEDEETRAYRMEIEKQKSMREKILKDKEIRRRKAAEGKTEKLDDATQQQSQQQSVVSGSGGGGGGGGSGSSGTNSGQDQQHQSKLTPIIVTEKKIISLKKKSTNESTPTVTSSSSATQPATSSNNNNNSNNAGGHTSSSSFTSNNKKLDQSTTIRVSKSVRTTTPPRPPPQQHQQQQQQTHHQPSITKTTKQRQQSSKFIEEYDYDEDELLADSPEPPPVESSSNQPQPPIRFANRRVIATSSSSSSSSSKYLNNSNKDKNDLKIKTPPLPPPTIINSSNSTKSKGIFDRLDRKIVGVNEADKRKIQRIVINNTTTD